MDPIADQIRATLRDCSMAVTAWESDPHPPTPHEIHFVEGMTALATICNQLAERLINAMEGQ